TERLVNRRLDVSLGDMQRADPVPLAGVLAEVALCCVLPRLLDRQSAGTVAGEDGIGGIEARHDGRRKLSLAASIGEAEEHPAPLTEARDQAGLGHQLQMTADARLALPEDLGQVFDVELAAGKQRQDAQAR